MSRQSGKCIFGKYKKVRIWGWGRKDKELRGRHRCVRRYHQDDKRNHFLDVIMCFIFLIYCLSTVQSSVRSRKNSVYNFKKKQNRKKQLAVETFCIIVVNFEKFWTLESLQKQACCAVINVRARLITSEMVKVVLMHQKISLLDEWCPSSCTIGRASIFYNVKQVIKREIQNAVQHFRER